MRRSITKFVVALVVFGCVVCGGLFASADDFSGPYFKTDEFVPGGILQLLAGEEGVTLRADFYANILLRRTCLNYITAGAFNSSLLIIGMDSFLHCSGSPLSGTQVP